ncbi:MAG: GFA family protein [Paracoccaceae bacterium]
MTTGSCLCGAVRLTLSTPPREVDACHCGMCRKLTGGGPMLALHQPGGARPAVEGEEHVSVYRSSDWAERAFCARCGTPLWYRFVERDFHSLSAGLFDAEALTLTKQIFIEAKPGLYDLANDTPKLTEAEVIAAFSQEHGG